MIINNSKLKIKDLRFTTNKQLSIFNLQSGIFNLQSSIKNNKGLTLLEIAISMAILAIALVALSSLFPIGLKFSRRASTFSEASILAQRVIENIKRAASIYDEGTIVLGVCYGDNGIGITDPCCSDGDGIGYFELVAQDTAPYGDSNVIIDNSKYPTFIYKYSDTTMEAHVLSVNDPNINNPKLSQKVYVAIYWKEADKDRADTFITYISNPFYEKYK